MIHHTGRRHTGLSLLLLAVIACAPGCADFKTIMIPRYSADSTRATDPFGGEVYRIDRTVDGREYTLLLSAVGDTLFLGARTGADFRGDVRWHAGECLLEFGLDAEQADGEVTVALIGDLETQGPPVGRRTVADGIVTVRLDLPRTTLVKGDGTIILEFLPRGGGETIDLPASGRLRGVYLMQ